VAEHHFEINRRGGWSIGACCRITDAAEVAGYATACGNCHGRPPELAATD
jgi:hypothetical protein